MGRALAVAALVCLALTSAGGATPADESLTITGNDTQAHAARGNYDGVEFRLIITGTFTITYENGNSTVWDAMYCMKGFCSKPEPSSPIDMLVPGNQPLPSTYGGLWNWNVAGRPKYDPVKHRYEIGPFNTGRTNLFRGMRFEVSRGLRSNCNGCRFSGSFNIRIVTGPAKPKQEGKLRVEFTIRASGKPSLPIQGAGPPPAAARVLAAGHATFPLKAGAARLVANETKGSVTLTAGARTLKLGIISGTSYFPATKRLALLLKVNESNDPNCEASGFLTGTRAATLTVLPVTGEPDLGTAIFVGIPVTKTIGIPPLGISVTPCKGYGFGWRGGDGAAVRIFVRETKLP